MSVGGGGDFSQRHKNAEKDKEIFEYLNCLSLASLIGASRNNSMTATAQTHVLF